MKTLNPSRYLAVLFIGTAVNLSAQSAFTPPAGALTTVTLPPDGRLNFSSVNIPSGATVIFTRNAANTPIYIISQGEVTIDGTIDISGQAGTANRGGFAGPGGFDGGAPGIEGSQPGDGLGPGAGLGGTADGAVVGGDAAYGTAPTPLAPAVRDGRTYGSQLLIPIVGGSGGGGSASLNGSGPMGGGGGGGAIVISSPTHIRHNGTLNAFGGSSGLGTGSGGAVRFVAPIISGNGTISVYGRNPRDGHGRVRCDMVDGSNFNLTIQPAEAPRTLDQYLPVIFPPNLPTLRMVSVAGQDVPLNSPSGFTIILPLNAPASQPVVIEASGFGNRVLAAIKLTPVTGPSSAATDIEIPNDINEPARTTNFITFPANVPVTVNAWTR